MPFQDHQISLFSDKGVRGNNEDKAGSCLSSDGASLALILADGMGGHSCGEVASAIAVQTLTQVFTQQGFQDVHAKLSMGFKTAHYAMLEHVQLNPNSQGMGTTLVVAVLQRNGVTVSHTGDSRAYQFRGMNIRRLTRDHLYVVEEMNVPENMAKHDPQGNVLSRALGTEHQWDPVVNEFDLAIGDIILLCSDGVNEVVTEPEMLHCLLEGNLQHAAERVVRRAVSNGSRDNCSVALAQFT